MILTWFIFVLENVILLYHPINHFKGDASWSSIKQYTGVNAWIYSAALLSSQTIRNPPFSCFLVIMGISVGQSINVRLIKNMIIKLNIKLQDGLISNDISPADCAFFSPLPTLHSSVTRLQFRITWILVSDRLLTFSALFSRVRLYLPGQLFHYLSVFFVISGHCLLCLLNIV